MSVTEMIVVGAFATQIVCVVLWVIVGFANRSDRRALTQLAFNLWMSGKAQEDGELYVECRSRLVRELKENRK